MAEFHVQNPQFREAVARIMGQAAFVQHLGIKTETVDPGRVRTHMHVQPIHLQQDGFVHAGVLATIADHTAGAAAGTLLAVGETVLSSSFTVHLLRPAKGEEVQCLSTVLRQGRTQIVCESEVFCGEKLVVKSTVTLAVVQLAKLQRA